MKWINDSIILIQAQKPNTSNTKHVENEKHRVTPTYTKCAPIDIWFQVVIAKTLPTIELYIENTYRSGVQPYFRGKLASHKRWIGRTNERATRYKKDMKIEKNDSFANIPFYSSRCVFFLAKYNLVSLIDILTHAWQMRCVHYSWYSCTEVILFRFISFFFSDPFLECRHNELNINQYLFISLLIAAFIYVTFIAFIPIVHSFALEFHSDFIFTCVWLLCLVY